MQQFELFDSSYNNNGVVSHSVVDRYYFPVIVLRNNCGSLCWTLARSKAEALMFHRHSGIRAYIDSFTWGIKTESGYFCCPLD
jgi:hypothetical protein